ncbi:hypothetical protein HDU80_007179 [Chytriomyces hyalinus]|nr:hypothetical protein HDU80_007179 [Chytriomyces hyalinus]
MTEAIVMYLQSRQIECCVFYDDFAIGELLASKGSPATRVLSATYVLLALGDDLGLSFGKKSQVKKHQDFLTLLRSFVLEEFVNHSTLERFTGKCAHLSLAFQGGHAFTSEQYMALAAGTRGSRIRIGDCLREELQEWECLDLDRTDRWVGARWLSAKHATIEVRLETNANDFRLGAALIVGDKKSLMGEEAPDWMLPGEGISINVREAQALLAAMCEFAEQLRHKWVDVWLDSQVVVMCLMHGLSTQPLINDILKEVCSEANATADGITREDLGNDYRLNQALFKTLERTFGPFTADAMASSVNAKCPQFFSHYQCQGSFGQNLLAMRPRRSERLYVFPPFSMLAAVVKFLLDSNAAFLIVFPQNWDSWWLALLRRAKSAKRIGIKGNTNVFSGYNKKTKTITPLPNPLDMWGDFRFCFRCGEPVPDIQPKGTVVVNEEYIAARATTSRASGLPPPKRFLTSRATRPAVGIWMATPQDIVEYLIGKELDGRTQYHSSLCPRALLAKVGSRINKDCDPFTCQIRAAPGSIRTAASHLKSGLAGLGLLGPWNAGQGTGNPVDSKKVTLQIAHLEDEAAKASVLPLQAAPLNPDFLDKFEAATLCRIGDKCTSRRTRLAWRQFWLLCLTVGQSGRRPGDLVRLRTPGLTWLPDRSGVVVTLTMGKTASRSNPDRFVMRDKKYLTALTLYACDCKWAGIDLTVGARYIFPKIEEHGEDDAPTSAPCANDMFQSLLKELGDFQGETLYGFRVGGAVAAALDTSNLQAVQVAGGWRSLDSAKRYSQWVVVAAHAGAEDAPLEVTRQWLTSRSDYAYFT